MNSIAPCLIFAKKRLKPALFFAIINLDIHEKIYIQEENFKTSQHEGEKIFLKSYSRKIVNINLNTCRG